MLAYRDFSRIGAANRLHSLAPADPFYGRGREILERRERKKTVRVAYQLGHPLENTKSESVKPVVIMKMLGRAVLKAVDEQEITHVNEFGNWNDEEQRADLERLQAIYGVFKPNRIEKDWTKTSQ